jgi:hypothetical protein
MNCSHISRVKEWGFTEDHNFKAILWDCVLCGEVSDVGWLGLDDNEAIDHTACDEDCFGCKARGLQFGTGDASRDIPDKKWTGELQAYRDARAQGIQPAGTTRAHVEAAYEASATLGKAYNAETMPKTKDINKKTTEVLKEVGAI